MKKVMLVAGLMMTLVACGTKEEAAPAADSTATTDTLVVPTTDSSATITLEQPSVMK